MSKILFVLKRREDYHAIVHSHVGLSTGLYNSAKFMHDMLDDMGFRVSIEVATDNNCIDRLVTKHRPTHVIVEALWVTPSKFTVLQKLHPRVKWIVRLHSEMPFMAGEGVAMDWIGDYVKCKNVYVACNAPRMLREIGLFLDKEKLVYLPNFYPQEYSKKKFNRNKDVVDVACFGAIRPLKNHLVQAFAAVDFANQIGKKLRFHINAGRIEMNGNAVSHNLRGVFEHLYDEGHELVNHQWCPREDFLKICAQMDIGLQCNFSETFNIVSADLLSQGVPIVSSKEIPWSSFLFNAEPADSKQICSRLKDAYDMPRLNVWLNQFHLTNYTDKTRDIWHNYFS